MTNKTYNTNFFSRLYNPPNNILSCAILKENHYYYLPE